MGFVIAHDLVDMIREIIRGIGTREETLQKGKPFVLPTLPRGSQARACKAGPTQRASEVLKLFMEREAPVGAHGIGGG